MNELPVRRTRFVVPFRFGEEGRSNRDYIRFMDKKTDRFNGKWVEDSILAGEQDLYPYILHSFDDRGKFLPGNIGAAFRYKIEKNGKKPDALIPLEYRPREKGGNKVFSFDITDAGLVLFVSGVGFFWYDISPLTDETGNGPDMDEDMRFNACFKELNYKKNTKLFVRRDGDTVFTVGDWTAELVTNACPGATFFAERKNALARDGQGIPVPDKALLFQYGAYDEREVGKKDLEEAAYHLTKGYSKAYKIPDDFGKHTLKPFSNVLWYATREGVGYYAQATPEDTEFFIRDMPRNFLRDYFLLYVLALHEQYTILRFAERMAEELPADPHTYLPSEMYLDVLGENENDMTEILDIERKVMRLSTEINVFFAKSVRSSVSFVDHQDRFFRYILKSLRVVQDTDMIMRGLSAIQMLLKDVMRQEESFREGEAITSWRREKEYQKLEKEKEILISELYHDTTTGLYNKTALMHYGRKLYTDAREQGKALFVCVADMNGLKYINDNFGHDDGDRALRGIAEILNNVILDGDLAFRQGGDEFLVMGIREQDSNEVTEFAERVEAATEQFNKDLNEDRYRVAISYGPLLTDMSKSNETLDRLLEISDERSYEMKMKKDDHRRE